MSNVVSTNLAGVQGAGTGLRRAMMRSLEENPDVAIDFLEVAPDNWITLGGSLGRRFKAFTERYDFVTHGLSLSLGSPDPLDEAFVKQVKQFLDAHGIQCYSEHLSYCGESGHMYDLLPIPFTSDAVKYVAERIRRVQDIIERPLAIENVSYYAAPGKEMDEIAFFNAVVAEADCHILLDVNNVYVNSINHGYDPRAFIAQVPAERIAYIHVAGHTEVAPDLIVDTHGNDVIDPVWSLLEYTYETVGVLPTLLERDFNIPALSDQLAEVNKIRSIQRDALRGDATNDPLLNGNQESNNVIASSRSSSGASANG